MLTYHNSGVEGCVEGHGEAEDDDGEDAVAAHPGQPDQAQGRDPAADDVGRLPDECAGEAPAVDQLVCQPPEEEGGQPRADVGQGGKEPVLIKHGGAGRRK